MAHHPLSVRFRDPAVIGQLKAESDARGCSVSSLVEQLTTEGLRMRRHPRIGFRDGPGGRRAVLVGGPDVWEVIGAVVGGDVPVPDRADRAGELLGLSPAQVDAALAYYAEFTGEIDSELASNAAAADEAEALWRRRQDLLAG